MAAMLMNIALVYSQWSLSGNAIGSTDFLGSLNAQPLVFKVNNTASGFIDYDAARANTAYGFQSLLSIGSGINNSAFGFNALRSNPSGSNNVAVGSSALFANGKGSGNTATGFSSLVSNSNGSYNSAVGYASLGLNTLGNYNTAIGPWSAYNNTTGRSNIAIGIRALFSNATSNNLVAIGDSSMFNMTRANAGDIAIGSKSLFSSTSGGGNVAIGKEAMYSTTQGDLDVAIGWRALRENTTGVDNTAVGGNAMRFNTDGYYNSAFGGGAMWANTSGYYNTALGLNAMQSNTTGYNNTAVGTLSLLTNVWGYGLTTLGYLADVNYNFYWNTTVIGAEAVGTAYNQVRIGNSSVGSIGGYANWTNISDGRIKENVQANVPGLAFINKLTPVTYHLNLEAADKIIQMPERKDIQGKVITRSAESAVSRKEKEEILYSGFIAQDVEKAARSVNYDFSGVDQPKNDKDLYGLRYAEFVVPLVKAVQELSSKNDSLVKVVNDLQLQMDEIKQQIRNFKPTDPAAISSGSAFLKQNAPNPFYNSTTIGYYISSNINHAQLVITDMMGRSLRNIPISARGNGQITIPAGSFASGSYIYSLIIDGKKSGSKQMVLTK